MKRVVLLLQKKEHVSFAHKIISENTEKRTFHIINSKLFTNIFPCVEKYLKDNKHNSLHLAQKEGSCNLQHKPLSHKNSFSNKSHGLSKATWVVIHYILSKTKLEF